MHISTLLEMADCGREKTCIPTLGHTLVRFVSPPRLLSRCWQSPKCQGAQREGVALLEDALSPTLSRMGTRTVTTTLQDGKQHCHLHSPAGWETVLSPPLSRRMENSTVTSTLQDGKQYCHLHSPGGWKTALSPPLSRMGNSTVTSTLQDGKQHCHLHSPGWETALSPPLSRMENSTVTSTLQNGKQHCHLHSPEWETALSPPLSRMENSTVTTTRQEGGKQHCDGVHRPLFKRGEPKWNQTKVLLLTSLTARPNQLTFGADMGRIFMYYVRNAHKIIQKRYEY